MATCIEPNPNYQETKCCGRPLSFQCRALLSCHTDSFYQVLPFCHIPIHFAELLRLLPSSSSVSRPVSNFSWEVVVTARPAQPNQTLYLRPLEKKLAERWLNRAQPKTSGFPSTPDKSPHKQFEGLAWMVSETLSTNNLSQSANHESDEALIGVTWKLFHGHQNLV